MCEKENSGWQIGLTFWLLLGQAKSNKSNPRNSLIRQIIALGLRVGPPI
jgi:hypothetical protein